MEVRFLLGHHGKQLWTREKAREIRAALGAQLARLGPGEVVVVDLKGVEVFDYSFANEFFGKTILELGHEHPGRFVLVENLSPYTRENLVKALEGMNLAMIERRADAMQLIGKVGPVDQKTFRILAKASGPVTAVDMAKKLELNPNAVNERLTKLVNWGVVRREKGVSPAGREQYEYSVLA